MLIALIAGTAFAIPADTVREVCTAVEVEENHATQVRLAHGQVQIGGQVMPVIDLALALAAFARSEADAR
jgi:chemotaxis signal transduction protein